MPLLELLRSFFSFYQRSHNVFSMGSDVGIITPCEFREVRDKQKSEAFLKKTVEHLRITLRIPTISAHIFDEPDGDYYPADEWPRSDMEIYVPIYGATIYLNEGFWYFFNGFRYLQLVYPAGTQWLRYEIFDIVRALGQKEAWYCSYYDVEDSIGPNGYTLETWLEKAANSDEGITEYSVDALIREGEAIRHSHRRYYHDSFSDVFPLFDEMKKRYAPQCLLGLSTSSDMQVRVEDNGQIIRVPALFPIR